MMNFDTAGQDKPDTSSGLAAPRLHLCLRILKNLATMSWHSITAQTFQARIHVWPEDWEAFWNPRERPVWTMSLRHRVWETEQSANVNFDVEDKYNDNLVGFIYWR